MKDIDKTIIDCISYIKSKTDEKFVFGGSVALYIQGITLGREIHDIDVRFPNLTIKEVQRLNLNFSPNIDIIFRCLNEGYEEFNLCGEKVLAYTPESVVLAKKIMLDFIENKNKIKTEQTEAQAEKIRRDLKYLKENYNIE